MLHRFVVLLAVCFPIAAEAQSKLRPPMLPLIAHDPYFSVWTSEKPAADWSRHWTGTIHALCSVVRIDGKPYRLLGRAPNEAQQLDPTSYGFTPTQTWFQYEASGVRIRLSFLAPSDPRDLDLLSRPATYVTWEASATDGKLHHVGVYFDATAELAVDRLDQQVVWNRPAIDGLTVLRVGTKDQKVLSRVGDNLRIDWGHLYVAAADASKPAAFIGGHQAARGAFVRGEAFPKDDDRMPRMARDDFPLLALSWDLPGVGPKPESRTAIVAYDDEFSVELMGERLRPWWRRNGMDASGLLKAAASEQKLIAEKCAAYDKTLVESLTRVGGEKYADLAVLSHRQCLAAHKLAVDGKGRPVHMSKENFSNGCIATVDVIYPAVPMFLFLSPTLVKAQLRPVLDYAKSARWKFPFAPHDLGTYPKANGQVYGGGERNERDQMPVEETGNMLILLAALAKVEGNADFSREYWDMLAKWAEYLKAKGLDPENQLCTDDFAGHLAHNTNLSLKAILAIAGYADLCRIAGKEADAKTYRALAEEMAKRWGPMADDGDHFRLAFDRPNTWSQKYNLVWDKLLGLKLFDPAITAKELAYYKKVQAAYGLPLDNRSKYTKLDWIVWTATLADSQSEFAAFIGPVWNFADKTPNRVPLTDWYWTHDAKQRGFQARSVVGGVYIRMLADEAEWKRWAKE